MKLNEKCAIVTGAASGIGAAIVQRLAKEGASVLIADKNATAAQEKSEELCSLGFSSMAFAADVASSSSVKDMVDYAVKAFGGIDILVNNAGIVHPQDSDSQSTPEDVWDMTLEVNLKSIFLCAKHAIPAIEQSGGGAIVNIASIVALMGSFPAQIAYTASKGGIIALTRELAVLLARRNIRVNAICPGLTATDMASQLVKDDAAWQLRRLHIPMGRMGLPEEIAATVAFLASADASYITGQILPVDGGMTGAYLTPPDMD